MGVMADWIASFHFLRPAWLLAALPLLALLWLMRRGNRERSRWQRVIDARLAPWLIEGGQPSGHRVGLAALGVGWLIAVLALAGPSWQQLPQPLERRGDGLVLVLDLSLSMRAEDIAPSRLARARQTVADVLDRRPDGLTGLVVYAGDAHTVVPLTDDTRTIENLLPSLAPEMMPVFGSNAPAAIEHANALFADAGVSRGRILLLTDSIEQPGRVAAAAEGAFPVSILGIGTPAGATIPVATAQGGQERLRNASDELVTVRLQREQLAEAARRSGGRYADFQLGDTDVRRLLADPPETARAQRRARQRWQDAGPYLVLALVPLALLAFRRGAVVALAAAIVAPLALAPTPARAAGWNDLWQRPDQQAYQALQSGDAEAARQQFRSQAWRAAATYRAGAYERAAELFSGDDANAHYNRGNALARSGELEAALAAYDRALAQDPGLDDARRAREIVAQLRQKQPPKQRQSRRTGNRQDAPQHRQRSGARGAPRPRGEARQGDDRRSAQQRPQSAPPQPRGDGQAPRKQRQARRERNQGSAEPAQKGARTDTVSPRERERQQALEQWLRRVPDDPGGLLRRKFRYETQQRYRAGRSRRPAEGELW